MYTLLWGDVKSLSLKNFNNLGNLIDYRDNKTDTVNSFILKVSNGENYPVTSSDILYDRLVRDIKSFEFNHLWIDQYDYDSGEFYLDMACWKKPPTDPTGREEAVTIGAEKAVLLQHIKNLEGEFEIPIRLNITECYRSRLDKSL